MRRGLTAAALAALLTLGACNKNAAEADKKEDKDSGPGVTITADESKSLGLATAAAQAASYRAQVSGFGLVVGLDAIAQSDAEFATAQAAASQSAAAAARAKDLSTGADAAVSREVYESAASKAAADQAALALATRKRDAAFGINAPWQGGERAAIMARLQSGRTVLVHVTFPLGAAVTPKSLTVTRLGTNAKSWIANPVWDAPADPAIPGHGVFALVDGSDLAQGERVTASIPAGAAQAGVLVPASALVLGESDAWAYLQTKENTFVRTRIDTSRPMNDGYFVTSGVTPGQKLVTSGAGMLYAHEINPSTEAAD